VLYPLSYGGSLTEKGYQSAAAVVTRAPEMIIRVSSIHGKAVASPSVTQGLGRVLVVDDDEVIRQLIAVNLQLEGFDVATAVDGQDCLDKVQEVNPDVITLDVMMPRLDGWETARGAHVGADAYLTKPFDPGEMIRVVRELAGAPPA
jgi:CheY-like chemotaxis protein